MIGYFIAFVVLMIVFLLVMNDSLPFKRKSEAEESLENTVEEDKYKELNSFLRNHVYKKVFFDFKNLKDTKNGYFYEQDNFSITLFEYPNYRTAQFFQVKPYQKIAVMRMNKQSLGNVEIEYDDVPEKSKTMVHLLFDKVKDMNVNNLYYSKADEEIADVHLNVMDLIKEIEKEEKVLTIELKHNLRRVKTVELPEVMEKYKSLKIYDSQDEKIKIKDRISEIESYLKNQWEKFINGKKEEYERLMSLSKDGN